MRSQSRNICICAVLAAVGLIVSYLESFVIIPVNVPGIRPGLANIVTLMALYLLGPVYALAVSLLRIILSALLFGSFTSFIYSLFGALMAYGSMIIIKHFNFSIYSVSVTGAVFHNVGQIIAACVLLSSIYVFAYLPVLMIAGVISGLLTGYLAGLLNKRLKSTKYINEREGNT